MKRLVAICLLLVFLTGCGSDELSMDRVVTLRKAMLESKECVFDVEITADYQDVYYKFAMECRSDPHGTTRFKVMEPETISDITGSISSEGGKLEFDDRALFFPTLADDQITPVSAPWLFIKSLLGGYIAGCGSEDGAVYISVQDSYAENPLRIEIIINEDNVPSSAELYWNERRVISMKVENFRIL